MTLLRKPPDLKYWCCYEGTPGGSISSGDYYALPDGVQQDVNTEIDTDIAGEEWIYFGIPRATRCYTRSTTRTTWAWTASM